MDFRNNKCTPSPSLRLPDGWRETDQDREGNRKRWSMTQGKDRETDNDSDGRARKRGKVKERDVVIPQSWMRRHSSVNSPPSNPI